MCVCVLEKALARTVEHDIQETALITVHSVISYTLDEGSVASLVLLDLFAELNLANQAFGVYCK